MSDKEKNKRIAERFYSDPAPISFVEGENTGKTNYKIVKVSKEEFFKRIGKKKDEE